MCAQLVGAIEDTDCISAEELDQRVSWYDTKKSDGDAAVLEFGGMWSTPSLSLWSGMVAPDRVLSMS